MFRHLLYFNLRLHKQQIQRNKYYYYVILYKMYYSVFILCFNTYQEYTRISVVPLVNVISYFAVKVESNLTYSVPRTSGIKDT